MSFSRSTGAEVMDMLTRQEVAAILRLKPQTLAKWAVLGLGPRYKKLSPRCVRYALADVQRWLKSRAA